MYNGIKKSIISAINGGILYIFCGSILIKAIGFIASIVIINFISKEEYAYLSYATNIYSYLSLISGFGISSAILKFCVNDGTNKKNYLYIKFALIYGFCIDLIFVILIIFLTSFINIPFIESRKYIYYLSFLQLISCVFSILQAFVRTQQKNRLYAIVGIVNMLIVLLVGYFAVKKIDALGYVIAQYCGIFVALFILVFSIRKIYKKNRIKEQQEIKLSNVETKTFIYMGFSLMISNLFSGMMPINETFLVNNLIKDEVISANFKVAGLLPAQLLMVSGAIVVYYFPIIAQKKEGYDAWNKIKKIGIFTFLIITITGLCGALMTPIIIKYIYGEKYLDSIKISYILWIMRTMNAGIRMVPLNMLPALGKTKFNAWCSILSCLILTLIDYILIKFLGIYGVAYGAIFVYFISGVILWIYLYIICHNKDNKKEIPNNV